MNAVERIEENNTPRSIVSKCSFETPPLLGNTSNHETDAFSWESKLGLGVMIAVIVVTSMIYLWGNIQGSDGELTGVIDDVYIHFQYAKTWAMGHPFEYSPGDGPQAGNTSFLYPVVLGLGYLIGFQEAALMLWAVGLGLTFYLVSMIWFYQSLRQLAGTRAASYFALIAPFCSVMYYHILGGMEVSLQLFVLAGTLRYGIRWLLEKQDRFLIAFTVFAALAPLVRPEGVTVLAGFGMVLGLSMIQRFEKKLLLAFFLSGLPFLTYMLIHDGLFGHFSPNSALGKGYFYDPNLTWMKAAGRTAQAVWKVIGMSLLGLDKRPYLAPGLAFISLWGVWTLLRRGNSDGTKLVGLVACTLLGYIPPSMTFAHHWGSLRYYAALFPLFLWLAAIGWRAMETQPAFGKTRLWQAASLTCVLMVVLFGLHAHEPIYNHYVQSAAAIHYQQVAMGRYVRDHLPEDIVVGMNDAGAVAYFGERRTYDFVGLTTNGRAVAYRDGRGAVFELMERLPKKDRPDYFACYPHWIKRKEYFKEKIATFSSPFHAGVGAMQQDIHSANPEVWKGSSKPDPRLVPSGMLLVDEVDTADHLNEADHDYRLVNAEGERVNSFSEWRRYKHKGFGFKVTDGQRPIKPGIREEFTLSVTPGKDLLLLARLDPSLPAEIEVSVNGNVVKSRLTSKKSRIWQEPTFRIPAQLVSTEEIRISLSTTKHRYGSCHYWFYQ